jgi:hypothetical protein
LNALLLAQGESGAFQADFGDGPFDDFFTTVQAIPAVAGKAFPLPEPTAVPATAVPEPTIAPPVEEVVPELISAPAPEIAESNSTAPIIFVMIALLLVASGAYWYLKK